jgi:hypothetical protein
VRPVAGLHRPAQTCDLAARHAGVEAQGRRQADGVHGAVREAVAPAERLGHRVPEAHADAQRGAPVHRALEQSLARLEVVAIGQHRGQVRGDQRRALERVLVALGRAPRHVEGLGAMGQRVERGAGGHRGRHLERELGLVDDPLDVRARAGVLRARLLVAHPEERRPLGARIGRGDGDHRQPGLRRHGLRRVHDAPAAQRDEPVGVPREGGRLAHAGDLGVRAGAVEALRDRQLEVPPELLGDQQRPLHRQLGEHVVERVDAPSHDHGRTIPHVRFPCTASYIVRPSAMGRDSRGVTDWLRTVAS